MLVAVCLCIVGAVTLGMLCYLFRHAQRVIDHMELIEDRVCRLEDSAHYLEQASNQLSLIVSRYLDTKTRPQPFIITESP